MTPPDSTLSKQSDSMQPLTEINRSYMAGLLNDASIDCVIALDTSLKVTTWNKMCEIVTGQLKDQVLGRKLKDIFPQLSDMKMMTAAFDHALLGRKSFVPVEQGSFTGEYTETHVIPLKDPEEKVIGILIVRHDVAHRQLAEQELKRLNLLLSQKARELENRNAELITFSRIASHDLKEPLRKIRIFSKMFMEQEEGRLSEKGVSLFSRMLLSAQRAEGLTDDIFTFMHLQKTTEAPEDIDLALVLKMARHRLTQVIADANAEIISGPLPRLNGDRALLEQLFEQILAKALKFQPGSTSPLVEIQSGRSAGATLAFDEAQPDATYAWISFTDNGIGFETQYNGSIFEMFQRLHKQSDYPGNGIGLSLCKKIMELHGGFIVAQGEKGTGSTFTCYFPVG